MERVAVSACIAVAVLLCLLPDVQADGYYYDSKPREAEKPAYHDHGYSYEAQKPVYKPEEKPDAVKPEEQKEGAEEAGFEHKGAYYQHGEEEAVNYKSAGYYKHEEKPEETSEYEFEDAAAVYFQLGEKKPVYRKHEESPEHVPEYKAEDEKTDSKKTEDVKDYNSKKPGDYKPANHKSEDSKKPGDYKPTDHKSEDSKKPGDYKPADYKSKDSKKPGDKPAGGKKFEEYKPTSKPEEKQYGRKPVYTKPEEEKEKEVSVEGFVYCQDGRMKRPLEGSVVRLTCSKSKAYMDAKTNKYGYFYFPLSYSGYMGSDISTLKAQLVSSPDHSCDVATDMGNGKSGAKLGKAKSVKNGVIYTVGPFAFSSDYVAPKPRY